VDSTSTGYLQFYKWNSISNFFELQTTVQASASTILSDWKATTSLLRTTDGVIFSEGGVAAIYYYETLTYTWAKSTVTVDWGTMTSYTGTISLVDLVLRQTRDNWLSYSADETTIPQIVGFMNNDYVFMFDFASLTLTAADSIAMPCGTDQVTAGCTARAWITLSGEWFDIGVNYIAVLSPVNCASSYQASAITNASVRYYKLDTVWDIDTNNDGIIDSTAGDTDEAVVWDKGWTCMDVPTSFNWQAETDVFWQAPSGTW